MKKEFSNDKIVVNVNSKKDQLIDLIDELKNSLNDKILEKDSDLFNTDIIEISQKLDNLIVEHILSSNNLKNE